MRYISLILAFVLILSVSIMPCAMAEDEIVSVSRTAVTIYADPEKVIDDYTEVFGYRPHYVIFEDDRCAHVLLLHCIVELPVVIDESFDRTLLAWEIPQSVVEPNSIRFKYTDLGSISLLKSIVADYAEILDVDIDEEKDIATLYCYDLRETKEYDFQVFCFVEEDGQILLPADDFRQAIYHMTFL